MIIISPNQIIAQLLHTTQTWSFIHLHISIFRYGPINLCIRNVSFHVKVEYIFNGRFCKHWAVLHGKTGPRDLLFESNDVGSVKWTSTRENVS